MFSLLIYLFYKCGISVSENYFSFCKCLLFCWYVACELSFLYFFLFCLLLLCHRHKSTRVQKSILRMITNIIKFDNIQTSVRIFFNIHAHTLPPRFPLLLRLAFILLPFVSPPFTSLRLFSLPSALLTLLTYDLLLFLIILLLLWFSLSLTLLAPVAPMQHAVCCSCFTTKQ